jgi:6-phosphogluconolactonase
MIRKIFFSKIDIPQANIHHIDIDGPAKDAAEKYEQDLRTFFELKAGLAPQFDLIILGIGEDGHTASLFPNHEALSERWRLACAVSYPGAKYERITLSLPVINNAKTIVFLVTGSNKAPIINEIIEKRNTHLPVFLVKPNDGELCYLMDKYAASKINYRPENERSSPILD